MSDPTTRSIDRLFDFIDNAVDATDRVLNRSKYTDEQLQEQAQERRRKRREVIDAVPEKAAKPSSSTAVAKVEKKSHFYIAESVDPKSGKTLYVVTDGGNARTECATREFAAQILQALEKAP